MPIPNVRFRKLPAEIARAIVKVDIPESLGLGAQTADVILPLAQKSFNSRLYDLGSGRRFVGGNPIGQILNLALSPSCDLQNDRKNLRGLLQGEHPLGRE